MDSAKGESHSEERQSKVNVKEILHEVSFVSLAFVDIFGGGRSVIIPVERFQQVIAAGEPFDGSALESRTRSIEENMVLKPDMSTMIKLSDRLARVVCSVRGSDGLPFLGDPRTALMTVLKGVGDLASRYRAGAELEFYLLDSAGFPVDSGEYYSDYSPVSFESVHEAVRRLISYGVPVVSSHHEASDGQYEIDIDYLDPLALADALILSRQIVKEEASRLGLKATFMPRPFGHLAGSGLHLHQQVEGFKVLDNGMLDHQALSFLGGQLAHAKGLSLLAAPTVNSYKRLHQGPEAPSTISWAHINRAALLRVTGDQDSAPSFEYRGADPLANPYLIIAGLLAAGADGMDKQLEAGEPLEEEFGGFDPATAETTRLLPLPRELDAALDSFLDDDFLVDTFHQELIIRLVAGLRAQAEEYRSHISRWELERFMDQI
jgi:glutamine synthetase